MSVAIERLVNLALYLASAKDAVSRDDVRREVEGYPSADEQDSDAFLRMFERDKDALRDAGFSITGDAEGRYRLDPAATFASQVDLTAEETAAIRAVGVALLGDPAFPFADELRFALAKLATTLEAVDAPVVARLADERPADQGADVAALDRAAALRKSVRFDYTNSAHERKSHALEPYGLFIRDGRWYVVGRDSELDEIRTYAVCRMKELIVNAARPKSPDFDRPADFNVARYISLPFQYGAEEFLATVRIDAANAWRVIPLLGGAGELAERSDGSSNWTVPVRDRARLLRWIVENGPGLTIADNNLRASLGEGLEAVRELHVGERSS